MGDAAPMRTLRTEDLTLEPQVAGHAEALFSVLLDPAIYEFENEPPASLEWLRERLTRLESRRSGDGSELWLNWVVRRGGEVIGYVQATVYSDGRAAIAYVFGSASWGRGWASRSVRAMIAELGESCGVRCLEATLKGANHRSLRLLERLGFSLAPEPLRGLRGVEEDELLMAYDITMISI